MFFLSRACFPRERLRPFVTLSRSLSFSLFSPFFSLPFACARDLVVVVCVFLCEEGAPNFSQVNFLDGLFLRGALIGDARAARAVFRLFRGCSQSFVFSATSALSRSVFLLQRALVTPAPPAPPT